MNNIEEFEENYDDDDSEGDFYDQQRIHCYKCAIYMEQDRYDDILKCIMADDKMCFMHENDFVLHSNGQYMENSFFAWKQIKSMNRSYDIINKKLLNALKNDANMHALDSLKLKIKKNGNVHLITGEPNNYIKFASVHFNTNGVLIKFSNHVSSQLLYVKMIFDEPFSIIQQIQNEKH